MNNLKVAHALMSMMFTDYPNFKTIQGFKKALKNHDDLYLCQEYENSSVSSVTDSILNSYQEITGDSL